MAMLKFQKKKYYTCAFRTRSVCVLYEIVSMFQYVTWPYYSVIP